MTDLDREVLRVYEEIGALEPQEQGKALAKWWAYLNETCTREAPCIECRRELDNQGLSP